jgi:hypothetical protein
LVKKLLLAVNNKDALGGVFAINLSKELCLCQNAGAAFVGGAL